MMYFAADGSYGDATEMVIAGVDDWSTEDLDNIMEAPDHERLSIAIQLCVKNETSHYQVGRTMPKWLPM